MQNSSLSFLSKAGYWLVVTLILGGSLAAMAYKIDEPMWEKEHQGFHMSEYPLNAKNYLRFGYLKTGLGLVENVGTQIPADGFTYRVDHGFVTPLLISIAYAIFGIQNWSARLAPTLLTMGLGVLTLLLTRNLVANKWVGVLALFFYAFSPLALYFGPMPAPHMMGTFFAILVFFLYWRWFQTQHRGYLAAFWAILVAGAFTNWVVFFVVPPILLHYLIFWPAPRNWRFVIAFALSPFVLFSAYLLWVFWLQGASSLTFLWDKFLFRTLSSNSEDNPYLFTTRELWRITYERALYWLTTPVVVLAAGWLVGIGKTALVSRRISAAQGLVVALLLLGFSHNIIFSNRVIIHNYVMYYHLLPAFAIAAALALWWLINYPLQRSWPLAALLIFVTGGLFLDQSKLVYQYEHTRQPILTDAYYIGQALNAIVPPAGRFLDAAGLAAVGERRPYVIADRANHQIQTFEQFQQLVDVHTTPPFDAIIVSNSDKLELHFRQYLVETYPRQEVAGHSIFLLNQKGSNILVNNPAIDHPQSILFEGQIEFLGYTASPVVYRPALPQSWFARYLAPHADLLPENLTAFKITNYWRKLTPETPEFTLITRLTANNQESYQLTPTHNGLTSLYPTNLWPVGQIIRQEVEIIAPSDYPNVKYNLQIGVSQADSPIRPTGEALITDNNGRVTVGQIDLRPATAPPGRPAPPSPQIVTNTPLGDQIQLAGYTLTPAAEGLTVDTFWQKTADSAQDYRFFLKLTGPAASVTQPVTLPAPRLWTPNQFYSGQTTFSPHLLSGEYQLELLVQNEAGQQQAWPLTTVSWCQPMPLPVIHQIGQPDGLADDAFRLEAEKPFNISFNLQNKQDVEILIGWTGDSEFQETRVQAFATNQAWFLGVQKYLTTLAVNARQPTPSQVKFPSKLTIAGRNNLDLTIPEQALIGWRALAATLIPGLEPLLRSSLTPTNGWIDVDFVQVRLTNPPITPRSIDQLAAFSPTQLIDAYTYLHSGGHCLNLPNQPEVLHNIQTRLQNINWSETPEDDLLYAQAYGPPALQQQLQTYLADTVPSNINQILVDQTGQQKLRVLGYAIQHKPGTLELDIYFQALDNLQEDYTATLYAQTNNQEFLFDSNLPASTWEPGRVYNASFRSRAFPGDYNLALFVQENRTQSRLQPENSTSEALSLGKQKIW